MKTYKKVYNDDGGPKTSLGDILKSQQEKLSKATKSTAREKEKEEKDDLINLKKEMDALKVFILTEQEVAEKEELVRIKKEAAESLGKKLFEVETAIEALEAQHQLLEFSDEIRKDLEDLKKQHGRIREEADKFGIGPHVAFIAFIERVKAIEATKENVIGILKDSEQRGRFLPPVKVPKGWRKGNLLPDGVTSPKEGTELFFFENEKGELCIWATKELTTGNKMLLSVLREKKEEIRQKEANKKKEEFDSLLTIPPEMTLEELLKEGVGQARVFLPATENTKASWLLIARRESSPWIELVQAIGGVKSLVSEIPSDFRQVLVTALKNRQMRIKDERDARGLRNLTNQAVDDLHLVFNILSDALDYERRERGRKEAAEKEKTAMAERATLSPKEFLEEKKYGTFFADFGEGRIWVDKESRKKFFNIYCLFERNKSFIKVASYPHWLAGFFKSCAEFKPEGENFAGIPNPAGAFLRFLKNQLLREKEAEEEMKQYAEDLRLPTSSPSNKIDVSKNDDSLGGDGAAEILEISELNNYIDRICGSAV